MHVEIDYELCTGVGACEAVCPEVFQMRDDDSAADVLEADPHPTLWAAVRRAQEACPDEAIIITDDDEA